MEPSGRYTSEENGAADSGPAHCEVDDEFTLTIESLRSAGSIWGTADEVAAESPVRAPIPGVPGWVNRTFAGALLPADCADALAKPTPYLQIQVTNDQEDTWRSGALQQRMSAVLTTAADRLTETHGCSGPAPGTPPGAGAPTLLEHEELDPARACGLEGFAPLRASADGGFRQAVTGGDLRLWSCVLAASDEDRHSLVHFTVTQEPALVAVHRADDQGRSTLLTCAGRPTLVQVGHFSGRKEGPRRDALRPDADLLAGLADAVAGRAGCERG
ncbi:hypothetical protein DKT74_02525 [Streptomyces sp. ZEA17I]|uniref:hypothetical protein n=1 Tax=Streptomyces sp. ZEA17I TaxID=2202516 RepID=UPI000D6FC3B2|nr:hypothetical protein [Streptomyces sp. ZEA17I]PWS48610.1 hypothetical protein DKT74_02525 [Streptomyces sp. ZEA17I]